MIRTSAANSLSTGAYPPFGLAGITSETFQRWLGQRPSINPSNRNRSMVSPNAVPADFGGELTSAMQNVLSVVHRWRAGESATPLHHQRQTWLA